MFPAAFDYRAPATLDEALGVLKERGDDAKVMAGGQSLIPLLKLRFAQPALVLDIGRLPAMNQIARSDGHLSIGAPGPESGHGRRVRLPCGPGRRLGFGDARSWRRAGGPLGIR